MKTYKVSFFRMKEDKDEFLGSVVVEEVLNSEITVMARAFRQAPSICLLADRVVKEEI